MVRCVYGVRCAPQQSAARRMMSRADRDRRRSGELASVGSTGLLERSLIFDPSFAPAHAAIAWSQAEDLFFCYAAHDPKDILDRARAMALDDRDALSHLTLAWAFSKPNSAIDAVRRAIALIVALRMLTRFSAGFRSIPVDAMRASNRSSRRSVLAPFAPSAP